MNVFIMMPYSDKIMETYNVSILPAIKKMGLNGILPKKEAYAGPVDKKIIALIKESDLCVADLSGLNPNVIYEVALAHSLGKPTILITQEKEESIPFDIRHHRVIIYDASEKGYSILINDLTNCIKSILKLEDLPISLLKQMLVPTSISNNEAPYIVASCPISYRASSNRAKEEWVERPFATFSDHVGIRGLLQSFGFIFGLKHLPELLDPNNYKDDELKKPLNLYCIASPKANLWTGIMMREFFEKREPKWSFRPDAESYNLSNPKTLIYVDGKPFIPLNKKGEGGTLFWDFGLVIRGPHPFHTDCLFMALAGRAALGTEAACLAVTDPHLLQILANKLQIEDIDLEDHKQAFCAVVSIGAHMENPTLGVKKDTFRVSDISTYKSVGEFNSQA